MLVDIIEVVRHLCPSVSRLVTEQTVCCSITDYSFYTDRVLTAVCL